MKRILLIFLLLPQMLCAAELAPEATIGQPFNYTAQVSEGQTSCMLRPAGSPGVINGLPAGINFAQPGTFSGAPVKAGIYEVTLLCEGGPRAKASAIRFKVKPKP